jgi:prepilin-type N-terminal cleavage/methylation domain-containing protein
MNRRRGLSFIEMIIVVILIGVLATLAISYYGSVTESSYDKEAKGNLLVLQAAQICYKTDNGAYFAANSNADINAAFGTLLLSGANRKWDYLVQGGDGSVATHGCVQATRTVGGRQWHIQISESASSTGGC